LIIHRIPFEVKQIAGHCSNLKNGEFKPETLVREWHSGRQTNNVLYQSRFN